LFINQPAVTPSRIGNPCKACPTLKARGHFAWAERLGYSNVVNAPAVALRAKRENYSIFVMQFLLALG
jgi:hypothetical protein